MHDPERVQFSEGSDFAVRGLQEQDVNDDLDFD